MPSSEPRCLAGLSELSELLCGNCGTRQVQSSPFLLCNVSSSCLTRSRLLFLLPLVLLQVLFLFPTTPCWMLPTELLLLSLLPMTSWAAPPFQHLVLVLLIRYNPWLHFSLLSEKQQSCILYHMGLGCQGLPLPTDLTSIS